MAYDKQKQKQTTGRRCSTNSDQHTLYISRVKHSNIMKNTEVRFLKNVLMGS